MKRVYWGITVVLLCSLLKAQSLPSYEELNKKVWGAYSKVTQFEYEGYVSVSTYQPGTFSWEGHTGTLGELYGFTNESAYFIKDDGHGFENSDNYITDKKKILKYNPGLSRTGDFSEYKDRFPPGILSCGNALPVNLFQKQTSFHLSNVVIKKVDYDMFYKDDVLEVSGDQKYGKATYYIAPEYNYAIIKRITLTQKFNFEDLYEDYEEYNGVYLPTRVTHYVKTSNNDTTHITHTEFHNMRVNDFQGYEWLKNKLEEGDLVFDNRFGINGFMYHYSTTINEDSVKQLAGIDVKTQAKPENKHMSIKVVIGVFTGILLLVGIIYLIIRKLAH